MVIVVALTVVQFRFVEKKVQLLMTRPAHGRTPARCAHRCRTLVLILGVLIVAFPVYVTFVASTQTAQEIVQQAPMSLLPGGHLSRTTSWRCSAAQTDGGGSQARRWAA